MLNAWHDVWYIPSTQVLSTCIILLKSDLNASVEYTNRIEDAFQWHFRPTLISTVQKLLGTALEEICSNQTF